MTSPDPRLPALPSRRTIARGAAWAAPVVALGAAAPAYAATPMPPSCPTCLKPKQSYFIMGGIAANWIVPDLAFAAPLSIDTSACQSLIGDGFLAAFAFTVTDVKLRMSNGTTYTSTTGLGGGAGILGQPTVMPGAFLFKDVRVGRTFLGIPIPYLPTRVTADMQVLYTWRGQPMSCPTSITWNLPITVPVPPLDASGNGLITFPGQTN